MFGFAVDRGQDAIVAHAVQKPQAAHAGSGTYLDGRLRVEHPREHRERRADGGRHRMGSEIQRSISRRGQNLVLGNYVLDVAEYLFGVGHAHEVIGRFGLSLQGAQSPGFSGIPQAPHMACTPR
ncbi:hypothetical protein TSUKUMMB_57000 [Rhodococcus sp. no. 34]